jgi:DNA-binding transcriptional LysR family regulator
MHEFIEINLIRIAIMLADKLSYRRAAKGLNMTATELREQIAALETQLCIHIFRPSQKGVELTEEGKFLIQAFREAVALHERTRSAPKRSIPTQVWQR